MEGESVFPILLLRAVTIKHIVGCRDFPFACCGESIGSGRCLGAFCIRIYGIGVFVDDASFGKLTHELTITEVVPLGIQGKLCDSVSGPDTYFVTGFPGETAGSAAHHLGDGGIYAYGDPDGPADGGSGILSLGASC